MNPYLNQVYAGLNPNAAEVSDWIAKANAPAPVAPPVGSVVMPGQPVNVNAPMLAGVPAQFQAQPAPLPVPAGPPAMPQPPAQPVAYHPEQSAPQGPPQGSQDISVGVAAPPIQYRTAVSGGHGPGEVNVMGPNQERFYTKAAGVEGNTAAAAGANVASAMTAQQVPLDARAQYMTELAERESRDQGGRNEQNRQLMEDYEREAKELRDMKPDPNAYLKSGGGIMDMIATVFGGVGQGFMRRAGDMGAENTGAKMAQGNRARFDAQQQQQVGQKQAYLQSIMQARNALRDTQNDQIASNQRAAGLRKDATAAQFDQAGIGVAMSEAIAKGDMGQARAFSELYQRQAAAQRYVPAQGGGRSYQVKLGNGAVVNMSEKEFNKYAVENEGKTIETGQKIAVDSAKSSAEHKGKAEEDMAKRFVPSVTGGPGSFFPTEAEAKKAREGQAAAAKAIETMEKAKALTNDMGVSGRAWDKIVPGGSAKGDQLRGLQGQAILALKDSENMGTLDTQAERMGQKVTGDFTKLFNPTSTMDSYTQSVWDNIKRSERYNAGTVRPQIQQAAPSFKPVK